MVKRNFCSRGHEFTPENTRLRKRKDGKEYRNCIECERRRWREKEQRKRDRRKEIDQIIADFVAGQG